MVRGSLSLRQWDFSKNRKSTLQVSTYSYILSKEIRQQLYIKHDIAASSKTKAATITYRVLRNETFIYENTLKNA